MNLGLEGRRSLIVGASEGIGLAASRQMAEGGAQLFLCSRSNEKLQHAAQSIEHGAVRPATLAADVTKKGEAARIAEAVAAHWEGLDSLVFAVGGSIRSAFEDLDEEVWLDHYRANVLCAVSTVRALLPLLRRGRTPSIVILGAAAAKMPYPHQVVSNVHKAGLLGLVKTLAAELAGDGIRVNGVGPGRTLTGLWTKRADALAEERGTDRDTIIAEFSKDIPLGRFARPEEIAVMVTWLSSPLASYLTGQNINVDGGIARGLL